MISKLVQYQQLSTNWILLRLSMFVTSTKNKRRFPSHHDKMVLLDVKIDMTLDEKNASDMNSQFLMIPVKHRKI